MRRWWQVVVRLGVVTLVAATCWWVAAADRGGAPAQQSGATQQQGAQQQTQQHVLPSWQVGQQWQVQSQTYQMQVMGDPQWLAPVQWQYQVTGEQQVANQQCNVVQVTQQGQPAQQGPPGPLMTLYVNQRDLNLVQVDSVVTVGGQEQIVTQQFASGQLPAFYQLGPAPCQLPQSQTQLPTQASGTQQSAPTQKTFKAMVPVTGGLVFEADVTQTVENISSAQLRQMLPEPATSMRAPQVEQKLFKVTLEAPGLTTVQVVGSKSPWPVYSETPTQRSWLVGVTEPAVQGGAIR